MFDRVIWFQAQQRPDATAIQFQDEAFSYARFVADIGRCASWLTTRDLPKGSRALLYVPHPYVHWVLTVALALHGVISAACARASSQPADMKLVNAQVLFTSQLPAGPALAQTILIDQAWIDGLWSFSEAWPGSHARLGEDP